MFYLINKETQEVELQHETKGKVRKAYKAKEDKDNWVVSKFPPGDAPKKKRKKKINPETGKRELTDEEKKELDNLYGKADNGSLTRYKRTTQLLPTKQAVVMLLSKKGIKDYKLHQHVDGNWLGFYNQEGVTEEKPKVDRKAERRERRKLRKQQLTNEKASEEKNDADLEPNF